METTVAIKNLLKTLQGGGCVIKTGENEWKQYQRGGALIGAVTDEIVKQMFDAGFVSVCREPHDEYAPQKGWSTYLKITKKGLCALVATTQQNKIYLQFKMKGSN